MEFNIVVIIIYLYSILYNPRKEKFEKYLQACKKIYYITRNICYSGDWQFPLVIYVLILFLNMDVIIASLITTKDHLNLLNYDRRQIK